MRAFLPPTLSTSQAVFSTSSRSISSSMRASAIQSRMFERVETGLPNVSRSSARLHISSSARSAAPTARMQWWMRPGPEPRLRDQEAGARGRRSMFDCGTRTSVKRSSPWPSGSM